MHRAGSHLHIHLHTSVLGRDVYTSEVGASPCAGKVLDF
jgi:hypothetical protein